MVQDVRSSATVVDFDLLTQEGVMRALSLVRGSQASAEKKRELRDLIFSYTNAGGDPALRTLIESELAVLLVIATPGMDTAQSKTIPNLVESSAVVSSLETIEVTPTAVVEKPVTRTVFGGGRPAPIFRPVAIPVASAPITPAAPVAVPISVVTPSPVAPAASLAKPVMPPPTPDPVPVPSVAKELVDEKLSTVAPAVEASVELRPPYREDSSMDGYRARIAEIKQLVNTKVGNPVNLVDLDNIVGRAYMTALLEAMKAVSGGGGDTVALMARLETVVVDVEKVLERSPVVPPASPVVPVEQSEVAAARIEPSFVPTAPVADVSAETWTAPTIPDTTSSVNNRVMVSNADVVPVSPMNIASSRFKNVMPVAEQTPLKTPADLPTATELKARSGITDPLQDPDVDLGLEQLLGEWSLFKKSGVFGTGPKGRQHPLFLKLASIPMPLILSGRFEGSTSDIKQSITDYMNGWRYEQGIIYEQEETFEHYLRRVIRHIIDSQTRRRGA